jgi:hypothetical protein
MPIWSCRVSSLVSRWRSLARYPLFLAQPPGAANEAIRQKATNAELRTQTNRNRDKPGYPGKGSWVGGSLCEEHYDKDESPPEQPRPSRSDTLDKSFSYLKNQKRRTAYVGIPIVTTFGTSFQQKLCRFMSEIPSKFILSITLLRHQSMLFAPGSPQSLDT